MKTSSVYWDYQNVPVLEIADSVLKLAQSKGKLIKAVVYHTWNQNNSKIKAYLEAKEFQCVHVNSKYKNAADFELMMDLSAELVFTTSPDIIILMTGDNFALTAMTKYRKNTSRSLSLLNQKAVTSNC